METEITWELREEEKECVLSVQQTSATSALPQPSDHFKALLTCSSDSPRHHPARRSAFLPEPLPPRESREKNKKSSTQTPNSVFAQWKRGKLWVAWIGEAGRALPACQSKPRRFLSGPQFTQNMEGNYRSFEQLLRKLVAVILRSCH